MRFSFALTILNAIECFSPLYHVVKKELNAKESIRQEFAQHESITFENITRFEASDQNWLVVPKSNRRKVFNPAPPIQSGSSCQYYYILFINTCNTLWLDSTREPLSIKLLLGILPDIFLSRFELIWLQFLTSRFSVFSLPPYTYGGKTLEGLLLCKR